MGLEPLPTPPPKEIPISIEKPEILCYNPLQKLTFGGAYINMQIAALATDEENIVMWDMDTLLLDYKGHPYTTVNTKKLIPRNWLSIDTQYALTTNVNTPLILFALPHNQLYIADGNHRLYKAATENVPQMNVIVIPQDKHLSYLFRSTDEIYYRVVDGLKDEGIFIRNFLCD